MSFSEERFPVDISMGSAGGPGFRTDITVTDSGAETRVSRWSRPRHRYDVSYGVKTVALFAALKRFYLARQGSAYGFRYKDFMDFTSNADGNTAPTKDDQVLGTGDASKLVFQLIKTYTSGASLVRPITKPVASTVLVALDGVNQTTGWTVNTTSGLVTFTSAPGAGVSVSAGFEFDVPVRFDKSVDDVMQFSWQDYNTVSSNGIQLVELLDPVKVDSAVYYGGAEQIDIVATYQLSLSNSRVVQFIPDGAQDVRLPELTADVPYGGPLFVLHNANPATGDITLKDFAGTSVIATIGEGEAVMVLVETTDNTDKVWLAL